MDPSRSTHPNRPAWSYFELRSMNRTELTSALKTEANRLGFDHVGACPAATPSGLTRFHDWLERGFDGEMRYFREREAAYEHPSGVLPAVRSILMLGMEYRTADPRPPARGEGRVSRYAWGTGDYHDLIHDRLRSLVKTSLQLVPGSRARGVVDTAPLLERDFARRAGLGWVGKNTMLINKQFGSWFFLAALLTDAELEYDEPHDADHCGTCRACLDACPTQAFPDAYVLDARKCISYLTIEVRDHIPVDQRPAMGEWLFGCDVCNDVCPWNSKSPRSDEPIYWPTEPSGNLDLAALFELDEAAFRARFRNSALWRPRRRGLLRNAAIVLGNQRAAHAVEALARGLVDTEAVVRAACAWALGQIGGDAARRILLARAESETDPLVRQEIEASLASNGLP